MLCRSCKKIVYNPANKEICPFCAGSLLSEEALSSMKATELEIQEQNERIKDDFEQAYKKNIQIILWTAAIIMGILLVGSSYMISSMKRAALIKTYGNEIAAAIENGDYETASHKILELGDISNTKDINSAKADYAKMMVDDCVDRAAKYASEGDYDKAIELINTFYDLTGYEEVKVNLKDYRKCQVLCKLEPYLNTADYEGAASYLEKAMQEYEFLSDTDLIDKLADYRSKANEVLIASAKDNMSNGDYVSAIDDLNQIKDPDVSVIELVNTNKKAIIQSRLSEYDSTGDIAGAIVFLKEEMDKSSEMGDAFSSIYISYKDKFREDLFQKAADAYTNSAYQDAINLLEEEGYPVLGKDDPELIEKINYYKGLKPQSITELNPYKGYKLEFCSLTDVYGNNHSHAIVDEWSDSDIDNSYKIDGKYTKLEFTLVVDEDYKNMDNDTGVHIYCDGAEVFTYQNSSGDDRESVPVSVDISGAQDLRIVLQREVCWGRHMYATDMVLYK